MAKRNIKLTDDPLTNITLMIPMLDEKGRESISHLMYGYCLGKSENKEVEKAKETAGV